MLVNNAMAVKGLEAKLNLYFNDSTRTLKVQHGSVQATPATVQAAARQNALEGAQKTIADNDTINALLQEFDGMVVPSSIQAL